MPVPASVRAIISVRSVHTASAMDVTPLVAVAETRTLWLSLTSVHAVRHVSAQTLSRQLINGVRLTYPGKM